MSPILTPTPEPERWTDPTLLDHLAKLRAPFDGLAKQIVQRTFTAHLRYGTSDDRYLEIGSGGGQLRAWLPEAMRAQTIHTEPSAEYLPHFRRRFPEGNLLQADGSALPVEDHSLGAVFALCTFDTLHQPESVLEELRRVLRPDGLFVHFLDLATDLESLFRDFIVRGDLPLPNFLAEAVVQRHSFSTEKRARLPKTEPLDDMLLTKQDTFARFCDLLNRSGHPLAAELAAYAKLFAPTMLGSRSAMNEFMGLVSDRKRLGEINGALLQAYLTLNDQTPGGFSSMSVTPFSATRTFIEKLGTLFDSAGFPIEQSEILRAGEQRTRDETVPANCVYKARWVGKRILRTALPKEIPGTLLGEPPPPAEDTKVYRQELAMHVFVARVGSR